MKFRFQLKKDTKAIIIVALVTIAIVVGFRYLSTKSIVPQSFQEARQEGAFVSSVIVSLLDESLKNLEIISQEDKNYNFSKAMDLVQQELDRTEGTKQKAANLTLVLDKMTTSVPGIAPAKARNLALEAVSNEVALISHLMIYNDSLRGLLETLRYKFSGDIRYDADDVQALVSNMNREAKEINNLNDLFNQKMREFDRTIR